MGDAPAAVALVAAGPVRHSIACSAQEVTALRSVRFEESLHGRGRRGIVERDQEMLEDALCSRKGSEQRHEWPHPVLVIRGHLSPPDAVLALPASGGNGTVVPMLAAARRRR